MMIEGFVLVTEYSLSVRILSKMMIRLSRCRTLHNTMWFRVVQSLLETQDCATLDTTTLNKEPGERLRSGNVVQQSNVFRTAS